MGAVSSEPLTRCRLHKFSIASISLTSIIFTICCEIVTATYWQPA